MADKQEPRSKQRFDQLLCFLGIHDFEIVEVSFTFGDSGNIEKLKCKRCNLVVTRQAK